MINLIIKGGKDIHLTILKLNMQVTISRITITRIEVKSIVFKTVEGKNGAGRCVVGDRWHIATSRYLNIFKISHIGAGGWQRKEDRANKLDK